MQLDCLITTYNRPRLLGQLLDSLAAQTDPRWRALIADDHSSHPAVAPRIRDFVERFPSTYALQSDVREEERATSCRFGVLINALAPHVTGTVMMYLCDDVELYPEAVATILGAFAADPGLQAGYIGQVLEDWDTARAVRVSDRHDLRGHAWFGGPIPKAFCVVDHSMVVHRREHFSDWPTDPSAWHHADGVAFDRLIEKAGCLLPIGDPARVPLCLYKITDTSVCRQDVAEALNKLRSMA